MKNILIILLALSIVACKSKKQALSEAISANYIVLLKDNVHPKILVKMLNYDLYEYKKVSKSQNQWLLKFNITKEKTNLKTDLLNHPAIITLIDNKSNRKNTFNSKKGKASPSSKK
ncbi:MAG: hypothetical protein V3V14_14315 [Saprospiraceae bacterium]